MILTNLQYELFVKYTLFSAMGCELLAEIFRRELVKELGL